MTVKEIFYDLEPDATYTFEVRAHGEAGWSDWSRPYTIQLMEALNTRSILLEANESMSSYIDQKHGGINLPSGTLVFRKLPISN